MKLPFIPAAAWPGTVQRYSYVPALRTLTVSLAEAPGEIRAVFLPVHEVADGLDDGFEQSWKSCGRVPPLVIVKVMAP